MSAGSLAKKEEDFIAEWRREYQQIYPGPIRAEELAEWIIAKNLWEAPVQRPEVLLTKRIRECFRRMRMTDPQGRTVRPILPIKTELIDEKGNQIIDVVYDHLHEMDLHHALLAFAQRDENIERQKHSASRDLQSALDNNPNLVGHGDQFQFAFMVEDPEQQVVERISQTPTTGQDEKTIIDEIETARRKRAAKSAR